MNKEEMLFVIVDYNLQAFLKDIELQAQGKAQENETTPKLLR
jgi:hypothetical protein